MGQSAINHEEALAKTSQACPSRKEAQPPRTLQAARVELQVEFGLGLGLQGGVAPEKLNLPLAVDGPGSWNRRHNRDSVPRCARRWSISQRPLDWSAFPGGPGKMGVQGKGRFPLKSHHAYCVPTMLTASLSNCNWRGAEQEEPRFKGQVRSSQPPQFGRRELI